ncbi:hypothetical protein [Streptomyces solincola]|uniref:hypothetical protein n=1 Tax=Streptomyces solincola TaxID=2100817 RepID=UPI0011B1E6D6|nr:hypothetical protein [Streptomyces solincola]
MAASTLLRINDGERTETLRLELATQLVVHGSTALPPSAWPRAGRRDGTGRPNARKRARKNWSNQLTS